MGIYFAFSQCEQKKVEDAELEARLSEIAAKKKLALYPDLVRKCTELLEQMKHRIGVVISGPPASGKTLEISQLWKLLAGTKSFGNKDVIIHYMNPKAVSRDKLLGHMDIDTREWNDGILTSAARRVNRELDSHHWIICDGEIDPDWIEALNSVLDDNHLLTLPNGERIQFGNNVNFVLKLMGNQDTSWTSMKSFLGKKRWYQR